MEPTNHMTLHINWYYITAGEGGCIKEEVFYKDHLNFWGMPQVTQPLETEAEHAAWWAWYRKQGN